MLVKTARKDEMIGIHGAVIALITSPTHRHQGPGWEWEYKDGVYRSRHITHNICTDIGDEYYAYRGDEASSHQPPTTHFTTGAALAFDGIMELYKSVSVAPTKGAVRSGLTSGVLITGSALALDSGYPKRNDGDGDNTSATVDTITYTRTYAAGTLNDSTIDDVIITNPSPSAGDNMLMWADDLGSLTVGLTDSLKVIVNHLMNGV
jgi:hypothetical protein